MRRRIAVCVCIYFIFFIGRADWNVIVTRRIKRFYARHILCGCSFSFDVIRRRHDCGFCGHLLLLSGFIWNQVLPNLCLFTFNLLFWWSVNDVYTIVLSGLRGFTSSSPRLSSGIYGLTGHGNSWAHNNSCWYCFFFFNVGRFTLRK